MREAVFLCGYKNCRVLMNALDKSTEHPKPFVVDRTIMLKHEKFIHFREHLLEDNINIKANKNDMLMDNNEVWHVMMFCSTNSDIMLLVYSDSTNYAKYLSIISNGGERIEKKFTANGRYSKKFLF